MLPADEVGLHDEPLGDQGFLDPGLNADHVIE